MNRDRIYRRLLDIRIQLNQLMADLKEMIDAPDGGSSTLMQQLNERRLAALDRYRRDYEARQRGIGDGTLAEDEVG